MQCKNILSNLRLINTKNKIKARLKDENGEGFKDAGTIYWIVGLLVGLVLFIPIAQTVCVKALGKAPEIFESLANKIL